MNCRIVSPKMRCSLLVTACVACAACFSLLAAAHPTSGGATATTAAVTQEGDDLPPDTFRQLAQALYQSSEGVRQSGGMRARSPREDTLKKKLFYDHEVTCNDGSVAGYYIRRNANSKKWVVFLEGT